MPLHLAATHRVVNRALEVAPGLDQGSCVLTAGLRIENGHGIVPDGPGLGVEPDPARVAACRVEHVQVTARTGGGA